MATINGTEGNDGIYDTAQNDQISGLGGDDTIVMIGGGFDSIDGGTGRDRLYFRFDALYPFNARTAGLTINTTQNGSSISGDAMWADGGSITGFSNFEDVTVSHLNGTADDSITTGAGDDFIMGQAGNDVLNLGAGLDTVQNTFLGDASGNGPVTMTLLSQDANGFNGFVTSPGGRLDFTGVDVFKLTANASSATLFGGDNNDSLSAGSGVNVLDGGAGNDALSAQGSNDTISGGAGDDTVSSIGSGVSRLDGGEGNDVIRVSDRSTALGGAGEDRLVVNFSNQYNISSAGGVILNAPTADPAGGYQGSITQVLGATPRQVDFSGIESFEIVTGALADSITTGDRADSISTGGGNDTVNAGGGNDTIDGGSGNNTLDGGDGDDTITAQGTNLIDGGAGNDSISVSGASTIDGGAGNDTISGSGGVDTINGGDGNDVILGMGGNDALDGGAGDDDLDGGGGSNQLTGGSGNDTYRLASTSDTVIEAAGGGTDLIVTGLRGFSMSAYANVENLTTTSNLGVRYTGNAADNVITGGTGGDALIGLGGHDTLIGGAGNDGYILNDGLDTIVEAIGGGYDTVYTTASYTLNAGAEVEALTVYERTTTDALNLTGNEFGQAIYGNNGVNTLNGNGGADVLYGLGGDDAYIVDWFDDTVLEAAGGGTDTVYAMTHYTLTAGAEVEVLLVYDRTTTSAINFNGNELGQTIYGNAGNNVIDAKGGNDTIYLMGGTDTVYFSTALGAGNVDAVRGFTSGDDKLQLDSVTFAGLAPGALPASAFALGAAGDADDRIVYDQANGLLWFDGDGNGSGAAVLFATFDQGTPLAASDFLVV